MINFLVNALAFTVDFIILMKVESRKNISNYTDDIIFAHTTHIKNLDIAPNIKKIKLENLKE